MGRGAAIVALALVLAGCVSPGTGRTNPSPEAGATDDGGSRAGLESPSGRRTAKPPEGPASTSKPGATTKPGRDDGQQPGAEPRDGPDVGDNALVYLRPTVPKLVVEVDAVAGAEPGEGVFSHLQRVLSSVLTKPGGIEIRAGEVFPAPGRRYSDADLATLERGHRQTRTSASSASIYVLFLNGEYAGDDPDPDEPKTLGVAYSGSAYAIFRDQADGASGVLVSSPQIQRAVVVHEAGHLLRLVNIGYRSPRDHEDAQHPKHSKNPRSVMYWAVESDLVSRVLNGAPPADFDADDRADLDDLRAGRL